MEVGASLVADAPPLELVEPGERALYDRECLLTPKDCCCRVEPGSPRHP